MRYCLRTLLIVLALGPPVLAAGWRGYEKWREEQARQTRLEELRSVVRRLYVDKRGILAIRAIPVENGTATDNSP
jgi:hypothetical protein